MAQWDHRIDAWLANNADPATDPLPGMRQAGLLDPVPDYATLARIKAALVQRTGLLGVGSVWGGRQLVFRHFVHAFGTTAQQAEWAGRALAVAISEPKVGAHPKLLTTRAEPQGDGFRISGQKAWVSNGPSADAIIVFAITAEEQGRKRYSAFLVPRATPGLGVSDMPGFHALRPSRHCLLTLDGCVVPATAMLGEAGRAYEQMALPFRDIEDAVGTFGTLGALRHAIGRFAGAATDGPEQAAELGAIVALTAVFEAGAASVVAALDAGRLRTGDATLVGLRVLAIDIAARLRSRAGTADPAHRDALAGVVADLDATLSIARGPRLARQAQLGDAVLRDGSRAA
ncbi:MAG TPA: acyl-CoA dehydrogenase family protein [Rhodopila sp.]